jgi:di/tricarboxylate transporter
MDFQIALLLTIIGVSLVLFSFERLPADVIALGVMLALILTGLLTPAEAFAGFGSDTVMLILGLLILTAALERTGVVESAGRLIMRYLGDNPNRTLLIIMTASATLGAFMSNTASTAFFIPIVIGVVHRKSLSASKFLMPLAFSSILTSSVTLISTSTNIVVSGLMTRYGMPPMGMFELAPVGIPIAIAGILYMLFIGQRLIPDRDRPDEGDDYLNLRPYLTEIMILPNSSLIGKTLEQSNLGKDLDLNVVRIVRNKTEHFIAGANSILQEGDVLLVEGLRESILKIKDIVGIDIKADVKLSDPQLEAEDIALSEVLIMPGSTLIGRTLKGLGFRERYSLQVLGINRHDAIIRNKISQVPLRVGDVLLVQGRRANISRLERDKTSRILGPVDAKRPNVQRAPIAIIVFVVTLIAAALNILPLPVAVLLGTLAAFITRCITPEEAYREIEWKALILIGSMLALGTAMEHTGTADYLAAQIVSMVGETAPLLLLTAFFILVVLLTQPMSNQAAAVVIVPIALQTATQLGLNPRTFAMMIAVAASCSYLTPLEPSCLMVYGPGRYKFLDFLKVGSLLTVLIYVIAIILVPLVWPLKI